MSNCGHAVHMMGAWWHVRDSGVSSIGMPCLFSDPFNIFSSGVVCPLYLLSNAPLGFFLHLKLKAAGSEAIDHFRSLCFLPFMSCHACF